ncbi:MAG TPA: MBL fold metallo-hydrolase [Burkholderiales bacterium]|jgi:glyoxylase-like metal-dependent hydrolase (beta-lactamase superfamily II)|nr:MBL fold metallo-hydrolase [Burkholderiales bacterium]
MRVLERGWVSSNNIVFLGAHETAVVDTGYGDHAVQTLALLRHVLGARPLTRIVNTHAHSDHIGGNAVLQRAFAGVHTAIPAGEAAIVQAWDEEALHLGPLGQKCERFGFDATFKDGDMLVLGDREWRAIGSPGHDMASLVLYCEAERILISADALWENGFGVLFAELTGDAPAGAAVAAQRATLDAIARLEVDCVIPGHGAPFGDVKGALARAYSRLDYFAADPLRNARNAAKVTLSFLLMIEGRLALAGLPQRLAGMSFLAGINRQYFGLEEGAWADFLLAELEKSRVVYRADGWLLPA